MYKQVIVVRSDLKMSVGKLAAQVAHASLEAYMNSNESNLKKWEREGVKKVVLKCRGLKEMLEIEGKARSLKLTTALVTDAGLTELPPETVTCLGIGPDREEEINKVTGSLPML